MSRFALLLRLRIYLFSIFFYLKEFFVRVGASYSEYTKQKEGLSQGTILKFECFCFAVFINSIVNPLSPGGTFVVQKMAITSPIPVF